jgi:hypothetical protein
MTFRDIVKEHILGPPVDDSEEDWPLDTVGADESWPPGPEDI